jgi:hypothetical protein
MAKTLDYNISKLLIEYNGDKEYRETLRWCFKMKKIEIDEEIVDDEITADELDYDFEKIDKTMTQLYEMTRENPLFQTIYDLAAAKMISLDRTIGQSVLFSYDYLYLFHACLCVFIVSPIDFNTECEYYRQLKEKLEKR